MGCQVKVIPLDLKLGEARLHEATSENVPKRASVGFLENRADSFTNISSSFHLLCNTLYPLI
jgi:hypothetical protein